MFLVGEEETVHEFPDTRNSLLLKLRDKGDCESWQQFVAVYRPVVYRMARRRGMQDARSVATTNRRVAHARTPE